MFETEAAGTPLDNEDTSVISRPKYCTGRKFCPHCGELVSLKTYKYHRLLYFDQVSA